MSTGRSSSQYPTDVRASGAHTGERLLSPAVRDSFRGLFLSISLALGVAACGGGGGAPAVPDACAYVTLNEPLPGQLPGGASSYTIVANRSKGSVSLNRLTGEFIYTPNTNARGTDQFTFQVHRGDGSSSVATFRLVYRPRIMPLGDSITWGGPGETGSCPQHVGYRKPLYDALVSRGYQVNLVGTLRSGPNEGFDPDHEGHGAWTADELVSGTGPTSSCTGGGRLAEWLNETSPDVVLLHIGTNDLNQTTNVDNKWQDVQAILGAINAWESTHWPVTLVISRIIVNHQQPPQDTTHYNDSVIDNVARPAIANGDQVIWVDHENQLKNRSLYLDDLHPNNQGYARMADVWLFPLTGQGIATGSHQGPGILPRCP